MSDPTERVPTPEGGRGREMSETSGAPREERSERGEGVALLDFLLGEGEYKGRWFGDDPPMRGRYKLTYWWRKDLRALRDRLAPRGAEPEVSANDMAAQFEKGWKAGHADALADCLDSWEAEPEAGEDPDSLFLKSLADAVETLRLRATPEETKNDE